jgi:tetratricopeptide (TPR) repeat protein
LFVRRFAVEQWQQAAVAPAAALAMILNLYAIDELFNGMLNPIFTIAAAGLLNVAGTRRIPQIIVRSDRQASRTDALGSGRAALHGTPERATRQDAVLVESANGFRDPREELAMRHQRLGRDLKADARTAEARTAWRDALSLWTDLITDRPDDAALRRHWSDCANDLAWLLANAPDAADRNSADSVTLATKVAEANPDCSAYWNTLGAASYRLGDSGTAVTALLRAIELSAGGTAFDHVFLAMAYARLCNREESQRWLNQAAVSIERYHRDHPELARLFDEARLLVCEVPRALPMSL